MYKKQGCIHVRSCARPRARVPRRTHTLAHARICTPVRNTYCFSMATVIRQGASMLRYMHIACLVNFMFTLALNSATERTETLSPENVKIMKLH